MAELAQGSLDSLLGRLTSVLLDEAQLLGGVRGDVEFIRDEMESMNGVLLLLTEAQHRDHLVRVWMKQVAGLAWDCGGYVELYVRHVGAPSDPRATKGLLGCLRRLIRLLRTVPARHRVATRIRELKVRARDVGDRRMRYGVTAPSHQAAAAADDDDATIAVVHSPWAHAAAGAEEEADVRRRALLAAHGELPPDDDETIVNKGIGRLVEWLLPPEEAPAAAAAGGGRPQLRVFPILYRYYPGKGRRSEILADRIARGVYEHPSVVSSFGRVDGVKTRKELEAAVLQLRTAGKRFLILLEDVWSVLWEAIKSALLHAADDGYPAGSAIILTISSYLTRSDYDDLTKSVTKSASKAFRPPSLHGFFYDQAEALIAGSSAYCDIYDVGPVQNQCYPDAFAMKMLLHLLYVNPNRKEGELGDLSERLSECKRLNKSVARQMLMFCYNELHSKYRSCLLYLSVFPKDHIIRRTSLARRWITEGLIATKTYHIESAMDRSKHGATAADEAKRYFDVLLTRGFLCPGEISADGNVKSCTVHHQVRKFITRIATDVNFVGTNLPLDLAHHLSIHNRIGLQASHSDLPLDANGSRIVAFLPSLAKSSQWQLLKLLDLEDCKGLKKHHLKSICKILLLKYLSLRNTDVVELPKQIQKLQCLETLDIRQTKIQALARKAIVLPMLKYFLAGRKVSAGNEATRSEDSFSTVHMPLCIQKMKNMEILSHVQVSNSDNELASIAQLLKLRKLGVVLDGKNAKLNDLFRQIEKLHRCLRSLSIRIDQPARSESIPDADAAAALASPPKLLESLGEDAVRILGKLRILRCLRLRYKSYTQGELSFKVEEFQRLKSLVVEGSDITNIGFDAGAAPKLEMIVWSFATMEALSGVKHLPKLRTLELNGNFNAKKLELWLLPHLREYSITLHRSLLRFFSIHIAWNKDAAERMPGHLLSVSRVVQFEFFLLVLICLIAFLHMFVWFNSPYYLDLDLPYTWVIVVCVCAELP